MAKMEVKQMSEKKWTESQKNAIYATGGAVLVSAAAGSGKTAVLVQRVIERITSKVNPVDVDKLLIVTYTKAAAAEMKDRIYKRLDELISVDSTNTHLLHQQLLLPNAHISTIHSFCADVVRNNFYDLDISPDFRLADDTELSLLKKQALDSVLESMYAQNNKDFLEMIEAYSTSKNDKNIENVILSLYSFLCSHPFPEEWLKEKLAMYNHSISIEASVWGSVIIDYTKSILSYFKSVIDNCLILHNNSDELSQKYGDKLLNYLYYFQDYIFNFNALLKNANWDDIRNYIYSFEKNSFPRGKKLENDSDKIIIQNNTNKFKDIITKTLPKLYFNNSNDCKKDIEYLSTILVQLINVVTMFKSEYSLLKSNKNIADFSDLEYLMLKLLTNSENGNTAFTPFAMELSEKFTEVMVDEYQDANEVQELIFKAVSDNGKKLFVVGDVKQSIYGFRQANPQIFINRKESYNLYNDALQNYPAKIILDKNFRSRSGVTDAVNFVFKRLMSKEMGQMEYAEEDQLKCGANYQPSSTPDTSLHILNYTNCPLDMTTLEARHIAKKIKAMVGNYMITDSNGLRPAKYSDFAILLRSAKSHSPTFVYELSSAGIPCRSDATPEFITAWEISVIISLLKIIDNPLQDIPLLNVLMSPIFGFTPDDMAQIRIDSKNTSLYLAVKKSSEKGNAKSSAFLSTIDDFRAIAATTPTDLLLNYIYQHTMFTSMVIKLQNGEQKLNNLRLLQEYAKNYEESNYKGLTHFVRYISRIEEQQGDLLGSNSTIDNPDQVTVMSIHRSKGLEFPVCFIANTAKHFNGDLSDDVLLHPELGIGLFRKNTELHYKYTTMPREAIGLEIDKNSKSEELRVLYVAMTRAREKLIITTSLSKPKDVIHNAFCNITNVDKLSPYIVGSCKSISDWLIHCALMHPSGNVLRKYINQPPNLFANETSAPWDISVIDTEPYYTANKEAVEKQVEGNSIQANTIPFSEIQRRLNFTYPYSKLGKTPAMVSASELIHGKQYLEYAFLSKPKFLKGAELKGAEKGTALHQFLQYANLSNAKLNSTDELKRLVDNSFLTIEQAAAIDTETMTKCLNSPLMERIVNSTEVYREHRFFVPLSLYDLENDFKDLNYSHETIIQGAVDCIFLEDEQLVIVDYKSDRVKSTQQLSQKYALQLKLYKNAIEQSFDKTVKECIIYSLCLNDYITV